MVGKILIVIAAVILVFLFDFQLIWKDIKKEGDLWLHHVVLFLLSLFGIVNIFFWMYEPKLFQSRLVFWYIVGLAVSYFAMQASVSQKLQEEAIQKRKTKNSKQDLDVQ